jgi:plastocyanin
MVAGSMLFTAGLVPAKAQTVRDVGAYPNYFDPARTQAVTGDTIRWKVHGGNHDVVTYAGDQSFQSSMMNSTSPAYQQTFNGGSILYRCRPHSSVSADGICGGMCGTVTDRVGAPAAPTISQPSEGADLPSGNVTISGTSSPWDTIRLSREGSLIGQTLAGPSGAWSKTLSMSDGAHEISVVSVSPNGQTGPATVRSFSVGVAYVDETPPEVRITSDQIDIGVSSVTVEGTAEDDTSIAKVDVILRDLMGQVVSVRRATCESCPAAFTAWSLEIGGRIGVHSATVIAEDLYGNRSQETAPVTLVTLLP